MGIRFVCFLFNCYYGTILYTGIVYDKGFGAVILSGKLGRTFMWSLKNSSPSETYGNSNSLTSDKDCLACSGGKYCDGKEGTEQECPVGHYCPPGLTSFSTQFPCPAGTYNDVTG